MPPLILSYGLANDHPVIFWIAAVVVLVICGAMFVWCAARTGENLEQLGRSAGKAIQDSDWYKAREEKKEIEAMERQLKKKELKRRLRRKTRRKRRR